LASETQRALLVSGVRKMVKFQKICSRILFSEEACGK